MFTGPVALNVKMSVKPERRAEFVDIVTRGGVESVEYEQGTLQFVLGEDVEVEKHFLPT